MGDLYYQTVNKKQWPKDNSVVSNNGEDMFDALKHATVYKQRNDDNPEVMGLLSR